MANTISTLGDVLLAQGDLGGARKTHQEALSIRTEIGQKSTAAENRLALATLALEEGSLPGALEDAHAAENEFHGDGRADQEAAAHMLLARILFAQQNPANAQTEVETTQHLSAKSDNAIRRLGLAITAARVEAAQGRTGAAMKDLETVRKKAALTGLLGVGLEARLAWGEIAVKSTHSAFSRTALVALQNDAQARGFGLIAHKAAAAAMR